jgi:hypothetical protein
MRLPSVEKVAHPGRPHRRSVQEIDVTESHPIAQPRSQCGAWTVARAGQLAGVRREIRGLVGPRRPGPVGTIPGGLAAASERLALLVTELAGNALRHASPPVRVVLHQGIDGWLLVVTDRRPGALLVPREPDPERGGGQGLHLVGALAERVGWYPGRGRKTVWALVRDEPPAGLLATLRAAAL